MADWACTACGNVQEGARKTCRKCKAHRAAPKNDGIPWLLRCPQCTRGVQIAAGEDEGTCAKCKTVVRRAGAPPRPVIVEDTYA